MKLSTTPAGFPSDHMPGVLPRKSAAVVLAVSAAFLTIHAQRQGQGAQPDRGPNFV